MDCRPLGSSVHGDSPGKNTGMGRHALLQRIFPTQRSNAGFPHCRHILYWGARIILSRQYNTEDLHAFKQLIMKISDFSFTILLLPSLMYSYRWLFTLNYRLNKFKLIDLVITILIHNNVYKKAVDLTMLFASFFFPIFCLKLQI